MNFFYTTYSIVATTSMEPAEHSSHGLSQGAPILCHLGPIPITNSMVVSWMVTLLILVLVRIATNQVRLVPTGMQNFLEYLVEGLYDMLEALLGKELVKKTFWFFASIFLFILFSNWLGLLPIMGNLTVIPEGSTERVGLFRAVNSDLNMPLALATIYGVLWLYWSFRELGLGGFLSHIFGAKGKETGFMKILLIFMFFCVGLIEVVSILFRQISLPLRLYGNIFAGETLLETMTHMGTSMGGVMSVIGYIIPFPFYFLEILVGLVQALVFMLLTSVFTALMCQHEHEEGESHHSI